MRPPRRSIQFLWLILATATALRTLGLSYLPAPNGDEGNWALYALEASQGHVITLLPEHRGSSPAFAYLLGASMRLFGRSFWSMRVVGALGTPLGCWAVWALLQRAGAPRASVTVAALLAIHPWSVLWSRTAAVPYGLALVGMTVGAAAFWVGLVRRSHWHVALAVVVFACSAHASPLVALAVPACIIYACLPQNRWLWRAPVCWGAGLCGLVIIAPLPFWMAQTPVDAPIDLVDGLAARTFSAVHMMVTGLLGESTVRHFTSHALSVGASGLMGGTCIVAAVAISVSSRVRGGHGLASFALVLLATSAVLLPLALGSARLWYMPTIDAERYVFAILPGFLLALGDLAEAQDSRAANLALVTVSLVLVTATTRSLWPLAYGHGVDSGSRVLEGGGCYRGFLTTQERLAPATIVAAVARQARARTVLYDGYPFQTLPFALRSGKARSYPFADTELWRTRVGRFLIVLWAPSVKSAAALPSATMLYRKRLARLKRRDFRGLRLERAVRQPDGAALIEIWSALHSPPKAAGRAK